MLYAIILYCFSVFFNAIFLGMIGVEFKVKPTKTTYVFILLGPLPWIVMAVAWADHILKQYQGSISNFIDGYFDTKFWR